MDIKKSKHNCSSPKTKHKTIINKIYTTTKGKTIKITVKPTLFKMKYNHGITQWNIWH